MLFFYTELCYLLVYIHVCVVAYAICVCTLVSNKPVLYLPLESEVKGMRKKDPKKEKNNYDQFIHTSTHQFSSPV